MAAPTDPLFECTGFDWDAGDAGKNRDRHGVTTGEAEDLFFHEPLVVRGDIRHSGREERFYALGQTGRGRLLFAEFTIRKSLIRVISVRDMSRKEREVHERHQNKN